ncbi:MAG: efflux RND transporter periplasmic adaptor subunit [Luteitalea sp.]|nr:efflux RND transporter periplasmic adaptor subunit [Luteitalea sp.]
MHEPASVHTELNESSPDVVSVDDELLPRRRRWRIVAVAAGAAVVFAGGMLYHLRGATSTEGSFIVRRGSIERLVAARGKVEPQADIAITSNMLGRIEAILVEEGDEVRAGQALVRMEDEELRARLAEARVRLDASRARLAEVIAGARVQEIEAARARLAEARAVTTEAQAAYDRAKQLVQDGLISHAQMDEAEGRHDVALARQRTLAEELKLLEAGSRKEVKQVALAEVERAHAEIRQIETFLTRTIVRAPVAGRILRRYMEPGEVIVLQRPEPILTLADRSRLLVVAEVDETEVGRVRRGQAAMIRSDAYADAPVKGTVVDVAGAVGRKTISSEDPAELVDVRIIETTIQLPDDLDWPLGLTVDVEIIVADRADVLVVPTDSVESNEGHSVVTVRTGQETDRRRVTLGQSDEDYVEVTQGLKEGDAVVVPQ